MRRLALVLLCACGGPTRNQLAETPSAMSRPAPAEAPAASTSDKDRERSIQQFDDMETTQRAHREAAHDDHGPPQPLPGQPAPGKKKKAPVEAAPAPPKTEDAATKPPPER